MTTHANPLILLAKKQTVGAEDASSIELMVLIHFDCARRGVCTNPGANFLTTHLIIASYLASRLKSKRFHDQVMRAYGMLCKASERPTATLALTTGEYLAVREALGTYFRNLPSVEVGVMHEACQVAARNMA
ncbi:hypothetical protein BN2497_2615 [Janthinobacterium sp. CG23_2]|nr:hypothetical protein BN2497_2615 [Janthinobacterium sp. CG23_2]CUU27705.1 hypothetical protein BN3177_2615 [Janthinobacterium sp. CG23_2]